MPLKEKVRRLREAKGLSQRALADLSGLGDATIAQIELGMRTQLRPNTFEKLSTALGVPSIYFTSEDHKAYIQQMVHQWSAPGERWSGETPAWRWVRVLAELRTMYGDAWETGSLAGRLGLSFDGLKAMLNGQWEIPPPVQQALSEETGVPYHRISSHSDDQPDQSILTYRKAILAAQAAGVTPEQLETAVKLIRAMQPSNTAET